jgi:hypothetical protein
LDPQGHEGDEEDRAKGPSKKPGRARIGSVVRSDVHRSGDYHMDGIGVSVRARRD